MADQQRPDVRSVTPRQPSNSQAASLRCPQGHERRAPRARTLFRPLFRGELIELHDWRCPGCDTPRHEAEYSTAYEVVVVRQGTFVRDVDGVPSFAHAGVLTLAAPDEVHRVHHPLPGGDECSVFRAPIETMRECLAALDPAQRHAAHPRVPLPQVQLDGRAYLLHRLAMRAAILGGDDVETEEAGLWFLHEALACAYTRRAGGTDQYEKMGRRRGLAWAAAVEYTARVHDVLTQRYHEPLTLAQIGRAVHCSPFHLSRVVRSVAGIPIHRLLVRYRLHQALERVLDAGESLSAIAFATGFSSHSHFTDAFRREFGCAPDAVRRRPPTELRALVARGGMPPRSPKP